MSDIRIHRQHQLGLPAARKIALQWAEKAEEKFDMDCTYEEGEEQDTLYFTRSGIKGTLEVLPDALERIETELIEQLDKMMAAAPARKRKSAAKKPA